MEAPSPIVEEEKCENAQAEDPPRSPTQPIHGEGGRGIDKLTGRGKEEEVGGERIYIISIVQAGEVSGGKCSAAQL